MRFIRLPIRKITVAATLALCTALSASTQAQIIVSMWAHAGPGPERDVYRAAVAAFNAAHTDVQVEFIALPEGSYSDQVNAATLARKLPCVLDFDGPSLYNYAWSGKIIALDQFPAINDLKNTMLKTLVQQGTYNGKLYSVGQFDSGLAIWGNLKMLQKAGVRIPASVEDAWTGPEFEDVLKKLKNDGVAYPLDMKFNYGIGEWITYSFTPIIQSFGGDLINRKTYQSADGVLNNPGSVKALQMVQRWVRQGYVNPSAKSDNDFTQGKSALSYVGHWTYSGYKKALGSDLVLIPMPRFGGKAVTGAGSWNWGISSNCKQPQAAAKLLAHLMSKQEVLRVAAANGAVPGLVSAIPASPDFVNGGPLRVYLDQLSGGVAVIRPQTPAYPAITTAFYESVNNIVAGANVKKELDKAVKKIDQNIEDNRGYPVRP
ncbi:ABC transporter substrate-binding protein [Glaciimonas immobilis]|uniref:Multiple sugar transport system substrate-binding protein n=1 Tax=Glaciimonas immobilis TaxID=728004 RepID=A0A840RPP8_9BURK|nr:sugar ABC transporter substrate-binding protein [Glaciimonas immobilis]KAF3999154.1 sugar ABC transporter substrate-binding protein [Glaciimonas immobilis]MBB5198600.1 multiple sugar transport system substrate-binding protein [Glaciimonas immobilis]